MTEHDNEPEPEIATVDEQPTAVVRGRVPLAELPAFFDRSFGLLGEALGSQGVSIEGPAFGLYHGAPGEIADLEVGFATDRAIEATGDVVPSSLPAGRAARLIHRGSFDQLGQSWGRLQSWMGDRDLVAGPTMWEVYVTEPSPDMNPDDLRTELNWLLAD